MSRLALGIDIGTSGVRAALLDAEGAVVGMAAAAMSDHAPDAGAEPPDTQGDTQADTRADTHAGPRDWHRDPVVWHATLAAALAELGRSHDLGAVAALAVDGTSGTVLALDGDDAPVGHALMYNDAVADPAIPAAIAAHAPRDSAAHGAASALARAIALQDRPGVARILHQADWIAGVIAGAPVPGDESNALKTGYDPVARRWPGWLAQTTMRTQLLPPIQPAGTQTGSAAGAFGLPVGAKLIAGVTDGCASFLATGASDPGEGVTALGTTLTIKLLSPVPVFAPEFGIYSHRIGERWLAGGASNTGGGVLAAHFSADQIAALSAQIDPAQDTGLDYYPLRTPGERFPIADPGLAPRLTPRPATDAAFLHGLLEGIARIEDLGYRRLAELGAPPLLRLRSVGGGAANPVWTAMRLRLTGAEGAPALSTEAAVGVARLALPHLGP